MGGDSLSTIAKVNFIFKLADTSCHSFGVSGAFNVPTASFNHCFDFDSPDNGVGSCPHKKYQKKISDNKKNFIEIKQI